MKTKATFFIQPTRCFPDGAPQREEFECDEDFDDACLFYDAEWREQYECVGTLVDLVTDRRECVDRNCPQHFPAPIPPCKKCGSAPLLEARVEQADVLEAGRGWRKEPYLANFWKCPSCGHEWTRTKR